MSTSEFDNVGALALSDAARYLSVSKAALRKWIAKGQLPIVRAGRRVLLGKAELDARLARGQLLDIAEK